MEGYLDRRESLRDSKRRGKTRLMSQTSIKSDKIEEEEVGSEKLFLIIMTCVEDFRKVLPNKIPPKPRPIRHVG